MPQIIQNTLMGKNSIVVLLLGLLGLIPSSLLAADKIYNVLFIQSHTKHTPWNQQLLLGLQDGLDEGGAQVNIVTEYLNSDYWSVSSECFLMRRICERARLRKTDLIVTSGDEAFLSLMHCGDSLGYKVPVVASGLNYPDESILKKLPNISGYISEPDFTALLKEIIRVFPRRTEIICLLDSSYLSRKGAEQVKISWDELKQYYPGYSMQYLNVNDDSVNNIIGSVFYEHRAHDRVVIAPKRIPFLSLKLKAPVFSTHNQTLTDGVLCAYDVEPAKELYLAGRQAASILNGTESAVFGMKNLAGRLQYDYKQMGYFKVDEDRLGDGSQILNIPLVERYKIWFIILYSLIVVSLVSLIVWLYRLNQRESRRRIHAQTRLLLQRQLIEQRDEFDNIFCSIRDGLVTYDTDLRIHFFNRPLMLLLGLSPEKYTVRSYEGQKAGLLFRIFLNGKDILTDLLKEVGANKKVISIPEKAFMQEKSSGNYFPVSGEIVPVFSEQRMTGIAIVCRNISEEEMQSRFFNMAVEESSIYPWQYNMRMNRFHFPENLLRHFKHTWHSDFLTREEMDQLIHPDDLLHIREHFDSILLGREVNFRMSFRMHGADGSYEWWEFRSTAYDGLDPDVPYMVLGVCQSIQRYKDTEEALISARDQALQADKLKSAFLANMSHEIRTPLNAIVGFSDLLRDLDAFSPDEVKQFVDTINVNCTLLLELMNDILDLSRIEAGTMDFQFSSQELRCILQQIYDSQRLSMPDGVKLRFEFPDGVDKFVLTDSVRLKQVVNNLINNAKKFTTEGSITLGYMEKEPGYFAIYVKDTGSGISKEAQKHIFDRFFKADNFTQGAGLGLSICQTIVSRFQGSISVASNLGKGTYFEVKLPDQIQM